MNKEYFMNRLASGESMDAIGAEIAAMMNAAVAEHAAKVEAEAKAKAAEEAAIAEKEAAKRELIEEMVEIIQELAILEGVDPEDMDISAEDIDQLVAAFNEMFAAMRDLKKMFASIDTDKIIAPKGRTSVINMKPSDDQILADFIKMFN